MQLAQEIAWLHAAHPRCGFNRSQLVHLDLSAGSEPLLVGTQTRNYLLELPRVSRPPAGERNYHVFFQLLKGASPRGGEAAR